MVVFSSGNDGQTGNALLPSGGYAAQTPTRTNFDIAARICTKNF